MRSYRATLPRTSPPPADGLHLASGERGKAATGSSNGAGNGGIEATADGGGNNGESGADALELVDLEYDYGTRQGIWSDPSVCLILI